MAPELLERFVGLAQGVDVRRDEEVVFAFTQLFRAAAHLSLIEPDAVEVPLAAAVEVALSSFAATNKGRPVTFLAKRIAEHGMDELSASLLDRAIEMAVDAPRGDDGLPPVAVFHNARGEQLRTGRELYQAEIAFEAAIAALDAALVGDHPLRAAAANNVGLVHFQRGDFAQAKTALLESLRIDERLGTDVRHTATTLDNLGLVEVRLAQQAGLMQDGGYVNAVAEEHLTQADEYFSRARSLFETGLPGTANDYVAALLNSAELAEIRQDAGMLDELSGRALEFLDNPRITDHTRWIVVALRGEVLQERRQPQEAVDLMAPWFDHLLGELQTRNVPSRGLPTLLRAALAVGDREYAERVAQAIITVDDQHLDDFLAESSQAEARHLFEEYGHRAAMLLGHSLPPAPQAIAPSWLYELVLNRKGVLAERQGSAWLEALRGEGVRAELLRTVRELRAEVARLDLDGSDTASIRAARRRHAEAERRLGRAEMQLHHELGAERPMLALVTVEDIQACLEPDTVLLDLVTAERPDGSTHYLMFFVRGDGPLRVKDLGPAAELDDKLRTLGALCAKHPVDAADARRRAAELPEIAPLLFDAEDALAHHIVVAPTAAWALTPFCLLPDATGRPLIDEHLVTLVPSARWIVTRAHAAPAATPGPPLVLGDPDFDLQFADQVSFFLTLRYSPLEHAGAEVDAVARQLGVTPVVRRDATRQRLLDARGPSVLHIATHGVFLDAIGSLAEMSEPRSHVMRNVGGTVVSEEVPDDDDPFGWASAGADTAPADAKALHRRRVRWLKEVGPAGQLSRSGLLMAGFNAWLAGVTTPADVGTGMLSAGEFAALDLRSTELVVLSACETGVGAIDFADGSLMGLRTAALSAGAACCLSTLWRVSDAATADLISSFYDQLAAGAGSGASLRAAQLALRAQHPDPYFWSGWVAEGEWDG